MTKWRFSYRNKLILAMLVSLLPVLIVQMVSYYVSSDAMKRKTDVLVEANLVQTSKNLDTSLQAYEDLLYQIITNDDVIQLLGEINHPTENVELSKRKLINMLASYSYAKGGIRSVAIFASNGTLISYDRQTGSPYDNLWTQVPNVTELPLYKNAVANNTGSIMTIPEKMYSINSSEQYGFHLARKLTDYNEISLDSMGVAVITVYESVMAKAINVAEPGGESAGQIDNRNFLADGQGTIISSPDKGNIGKRVSEVLTRSTISNTYVNPNSGWTIYNLIDQKKLFREMYAMRRLTLTVGIAALLAAAVLIFYFSSRLSNSIRRVVKAMRNASLGTLTAHVDESARDEISTIAFNFNKMMNTINELMREVKETGEKRREAEIHALEAQINPHFLYNSLDSINWLAIEKEEHQISQMLKGLAQILRYSIKDSNKRVAVQEELQWMDRYIFLQQHRFRSSFSCTVERDDRALDCLIPKLILQPFIENAIIHGFAGVKQGGELRIGIRLLEGPAESGRSAASQGISSTDQRLEWVIRDNGCGMDEATLTDIIKENPDNLSGIGIRNVLDRLRMYYGDEASCTIESHEGAGTEVRMIMPAIWRGDEKQG